MGIAATIRSYPAAAVLAAALSAPAAAAAGADGGSGGDGGEADLFPLEVVAACGNCHVLTAEERTVKPWSYKVFSNLPYKVEQVRVQSLSVRYPGSGDTGVWEMVIEFEKEAEAREVEAYNMVRIVSGVPVRAWCFRVGRQLIMARGFHHVLFVHPEHPQYHLQVLSAFH